MEYTKEHNKLGLPEDFKFGIELEAYNVKTKGKDGLYVGESARYISEKGWHMASVKEESLVGEGGAELVSPVLKDDEQTYEDIENICSHMKKYPGNKGDKVITDSKCGLHIHFDAECLRKDPNRMKNFFRIYAEAEELIYKMCNDKNDPIRRNAINKDFKGIHLISAVWRNGMAAPTGKKILKKIEDGSLKVSYKKMGRLRMLASKYKLDERRYAGLNLTNIGNMKKNTIEFRMANGTLDPDVIKQNIFLYASILNTAIKVTENPEIYGDKLKEFFRTDITEEEKSRNFLNLIMEKEEDRKIYMERFESVKDAKVFAKNTKKGFSQNRFKREELEEIAWRVPSKNVQLAYNRISNMLIKRKEIGDVQYDK